MYVLVLTACINPSKGAVSMAIHQPDVRRKNYEDSLRYWLAYDDARIDKILFVENSGCCLDSLRQLASTQNPFRKKVEFLSFDRNDYPKHLHYGYAELDMLDEAFLQSNLIRKSDMLVKVTGRLIFPTLGRLLSRLPPTCLFAVDSRQRTKAQKGSVTTQLMVFGKEFYRSHLLDAKRHMNSEITHIEDLMFRQLLPYKDKPGAYMRFPVNADPVGRGARRDVNYNSAKKQFQYFVRGICRSVLPHWWI